MKRSLFFVLLLIPSMAFAICLGQPGCRDVESAFGTQLTIKYGGYDGRNTDLTISTNQYSLIVGKKVITSVAFSNLETFYRQINAIQSKYMEWSKVAKDNNVEEVEKEIPIFLSCSGAHCTTFTYTDKIQIQPIFRIINYVPYCVIRISLSHQSIGVHNAELVFKDDELPIVLSICDEIVQEITDYQKERAKTENLFL